MRSLLLGTMFLAFMAFFSTEASAQGDSCSGLGLERFAGNVSPLQANAVRPRRSVCPGFKRCQPCSSGCTGSQSPCERQLAQDQAICERFRDNPAIYQRCMQAANIVYQDCLEGKLRPMRDPVCPFLIVYPRKSASSSTTSAIRNTRWLRLLQSLLPQLLGVPTLTKVSPFIFVAKA